MCMRAQFISTACIEPKEREELKANSKIGNTDRDVICFEYKVSHTYSFRPQTIQRLNTIHLFIFSVLFSLVSSRCNLLNLCVNDLGTYIMIVVVTRLQQISFPNGNMHKHMCTLVYIFFFLFRLKIDEIGVILLKSRLILPYKYI